MKKILLSLVVISFMTMMRVEAFDWMSALNFLGRASETQTAQPQISTINDFEKQMATIDNTVETAFIDIVSELSGWWDTRSIKSQLKSNEDALTTVLSDYANTYLENNRQNVVNTIKKMSSKEKTALVNNLTVLAENGQNYLVLAANGAKAATNAFKTAQTVNEVTTTITNVNKAAAELRNRATAVMTLANQLKSVATAAGVNVN